MRADITALLSAVGFRRRLLIFDVGNEASSHKRLYPQQETSAETRAVGLDAYKMAVLLLIGTAVLSLL